MMVLDPFSSIIILSLVGAIFGVMGWAETREIDRKIGHTDFSDMEKGFGRGGCFTTILIILAILVWWTIVHVKVDIT